MTKKDYEAVANTIRNYPFTDPQDRISFACRIADEVFKPENPRFSRDRFLTACRGEDSKDSAGRRVRYSQEVPTDTYNGWKNRQTWNVALWIGNDEGLYNSARGYKGRAPYVRWVKAMGLEHDKTPDGIAWLSTRLSYRELNSMMEEL